MGKGVRNSGVRVNSVVGGNIGGQEQQCGVSSTSKNRASHHKYKSPKQFELKQS